MKARYYVLTAVGAAALGVFCRHGLPALARAPVPAEPGPRFAAAASLPSAGADDLLLARIARDCGDHLLAKAELAPDDGRLLNQAAHHYRACLSHAPAGGADPVFAGARRSLERVERLLARARAPSPGRAKRAPEPPQIAAKPNPEVAAPLPKMVGPDGVIYRRVGEWP